MWQQTRLAIVAPPLASRLGTLAPLYFALLCGPFALVREPLPLATGHLPRVYQALALVRQPGRSGNAHDDVGSTHTRQ